MTTRSNSPDFLVEKNNPGFLDTLIGLELCGYIPYIHKETGEFGVHPVRPGAELQPWVKRGMDLHENKFYEQLCVRASDSQLAKASSSNSAVEEFFKAIEAFAKEVLGDEGYKNDSETED